MQLQFNVCLFDTRMPMFLSFSFCRTFRALHPLSTAIEEMFLIRKRFSILATAHNGTAIPLKARLVWISPRAENKFAEQLIVFAATDGLGIPPRSLINPSFTLQNL